MDELQGKCDNQISAIKHRLEDSRWHLFSMWTQEPLGKDVPQQKTKKKNKNGLAATDE